MAVAFNGKHLAKFIRPEEYEAIYPQVELAHKQLETKTGFGNDFLGWLDLPVTYDKEEFARIKEAAQKIRSDSDVLLVAGIGGSYLGARAVVEAVKGLYHNETSDGPKIYFCGNTISPTALNDISSSPRASVSPSMSSPSPVRLPRPRWLSASCASCWRIPLVLRKPTSASTPRPTVPKAPSSSWLLSRAGPPSSFPMTSAAATLS